MNRDEFLRTLREALAGEVSPNIIEENIRYYDAYITDEVQKGRSEEAVIEELGGPRVIARTIIDVAAAGGDAGAEDPYGEAAQESAYRSGNGSGASYRNGSGTSYGNGSGSPYGNDSGSPYGSNSGSPYGNAGGRGSYDPFGFGRQEHRSFHVFNLDKWYWKLLLWLVIFFILFLVVNLVMGLAYLLWPFLLVGLIVWLITSARR
ncbi:MAG TPA: DUF1700 domain-containing protein [Candidatus Lachnoclostridium pullistercoris]|uniref:DUF1700 domain-containing protein n=1 Tax=Candidatus Lachnoclostridium pullistercoris TaxID=2838632 RepID=A0A9D2T7W9_9FIRM|nr:DUF1700 domain-containing protein [Candidatus Lachnoclostridium pullistercoris]